MKLRVLKKLLLAMGGKSLKGLALGLLLAIPLAVKTTSFYLLWKWYALPLHLPYLKFWHSLGLICLLSLLTTGQKDIYLDERLHERSKDVYEEWFICGLQITARSVIVLVIGFALHCFISP